MKIANKFDMDSIKNFADSAVKTGFADAVYSGTVLERNLIVVDPTILEQQYPELAFVNSGITANNTGGYARQVQTLRKRKTGGFTKASDRGGNKGRIGLAIEDNDIKVTPRYAFSEWTEDEVQEAKLQGLSLANDYIAGHSQAYQEEIDEIGLEGTTGSNGLLNHASFGTAAASALLDAGTAAAAYALIADELISAQWNSVNNIPAYKADVVMLPIAAMNFLQSTLIDSTNRASVLTALKENFPSVRFMESFRADTMGVAFSTSAQSMVMRIPMPLTVGEIIKRGSFSYHVESKYRIAGLDVLEGAAGFILTSLWS